jgi:hypothetical protein
LVWTIIILCVVKFGQMPRGRFQTEFSGNGCDMSVNLSGIRELVKNHKFGIEVKKIHIPNRHKLDLETGSQNCIVSTARSIRDNGR